MMLCKVSQCLLCKQSVSGGLVNLEFHKTISESEMSVTLCEVNNFVDFYHASLPQGVSYLVKP